MPIIYTDKHTCKKCGETFEWNYFKFKSNHINVPSYEVECIPGKKTLAHYFKQTDTYVYDVQVNCSKCNFDNHFTIDKVKLS